MNKYQTACTCTDTCTIYDRMNKFRPRNINGERFTEAARSSVFRDLLGRGEREELVEKIENIGREEEKTLLAEYTEKMKSANKAIKAKAYDEFNKKMKKIDKKNTAELKKLFKEEGKKGKFRRASFWSWMGKPLYATVLLPLLVLEIERGEFADEDIKPEDVEDFLVNDLRGKYEFDRD